MRENDSCRGDASGDSQAIEYPRETAKDLLRQRVSKLRSEADRLEAFCNEIPDSLSKDAESGFMTLQCPLWA
jgi:hypothetical protein